MPKLANFPNRVEIDNTPYRKNELKGFQESDGSVTVKYSREADHMDRAPIGLTRLGFGEWTDSVGVSYTSANQLLEDLDSFLLGESLNSDYTLETILKSGDNVLKVTEIDSTMLLQEILIQLKILNKYQSIITDETIEELDIKLE